MPMIKIVTTNWLPHQKSMIISHSCIYNELPFLCNVCIKGLLSSMTKNVTMSMFRSLGQTLLLKSSLIRPPSLAASSFNFRTPDGFCDNKAISIWTTWKKKIWNVLIKFNHIISAHLKNFTDKIISHFDGWCKPKINKHNQVCRLFLLHLTFSFWSSKC
jgi:hypothetical protein